MNPSKTLLVILLLLVPQLVFAVDYSDLLPDFDLFNVPVTDRSFMYLSDVFGRVEGVTAGFRGQLLGTIFEAFNYGILAIAGSMLSFTVITSVINTANQGDFMGRENNPAWFALRVALGVGLLVPQASGYSTIQAIMLWIVVQSIGFADATWNRALDFFESGGAVHAPPEWIPDETLQMTTKIFLSQVCMYKVESLAKAEQQRFKELYKGKEDNVLYQALTKSIPSFKVIKDTSRQTYFFPGTIAEAEDGLSGSKTPDSCGKVIYTDNNDMYPDIPITDYKLLALDTILTELDPIAKRMAYKYMDASQDAREDIELDVVNDLVRAAQSFVSITQPVRIVVDAENKELLKDYYKFARSEGWLMAGRYYYALGALKRQLDDAVKYSDYYQTETNGNMAPRNYDEVKNRLGLSDTTGGSQPNDAKNYVDTIFYVEESATTALLLLNMLNRRNLGYTYVPITVADSVGTVGGDMGFLTSGMIFIYNVTEILSHYTDAFSDLFKGNIGGYFTNLGKGILSIGKKIGCGIKKIFTKSNCDKPPPPRINADQVLQGIFDVVNAAFGNVSGNFNEVTQPDSEEHILVGDPIVRLQSFGYSLMETVKTLWVGGAITVAAVAILGSIGGVFAPFAWVILEMVIWFLPIVVAMTVAIFMGGLTLAVYIPLIPYILFVFGTIAWLMAVIEALVAAPLIALGVTHPQGHEILGKAQQAVMLAMSLFLRPTLMIIGLLGGMILSRVAFAMVNAGFYGILSDVHGLNTAAGSLGLDRGVLVEPLILVGYIVVYTIICMTIVKVSFSLIHVIPEKVMRWLGMQPDHSSIGEEALSSMKGSLDQGRQVLSGAASSAGSGKFASWGQGKAAGKLGGKGGAGM